MAWYNPSRTPLLWNVIEASGGITGKFFRSCGGDGERARHAVTLLEQFSDSKTRDKLRHAKELQYEYNLDYQIYNLAKKLGQSEEQIKEQYTYTEIIERNLMEIYDNYIDRTLMEAKWARRT